MFFQLSIRNLILLSLMTFSNLLAEEIILNFNVAIDEALENNLELQGLKANIEASKAQCYQASLYPNPVFAISLDDIGNNYCRGNNELYVGLVQPIELGGKLSARTRIAQVDNALANTLYQTKREALYYTILKAFLKMATTQELLNLSRAQENISKELLQAIKEKTTAGKSALIEEKKGMIAHQIATLTTHKIKTLFIKAKKELIALNVSCKKDFDTVFYPLSDLTPPPPLAYFLDRITENNELNLSSLERKKAAEILSFEKTRRIPDIALEIGLSTDQFTKNPSVILGIAFPIPLFDTNKGNISSASYKELQANFEYLDLLASINSNLEMLYDELTSLYQQVLIFKNNALPSVEESFNQTLLGFNEGKFTYLDLLEASKTQLNVKEQYILCLSEYQEKRIEIFRLTTRTSCKSPKY